MEGPLDVSLPPFARIRDVKIVAGEQGRVGIIWRREVDRDTFQWDPAIQRFRVKGSDVTLPNSGYHKSDAYPELAQAIPPNDHDLLNQNEITAMAVVGPQAVEGCQFFAGYPPGCSWVDLMSDVYYANGRWHAVFVMPPSKNAPQAEHGIALVTFDASGWTKPTVIVPNVCDRPIWSFCNGSCVDLFWKHTYRLCLISVDPHSGVDRSCLKHAQIEPDGNIKIETVYECPKTSLFGFISEDYIVRPVRLDVDRYDILLERSYFGLSWLLWGPKSGLMHVGNTLSAWPLSSGPLAQYYGFDDCLALVLCGRRLQIVWDEEPEWDCTQPGPKPYRIMEVHYDSRSWSSAREITQTPHYRQSSLAGTAIQVGDLSAVLVVWQGEEGYLTYLVGSGSGQWSDPVTTNLVVGPRIWLAGDGDTVMLVTEIDRNLYWYRLMVTPEESRSKRG